MATVPLRRKIQYLTNLTVQIIFLMICATVAWAGVYSVYVLITLPFRQ